MTARIFEIKRFAVHDGDGIRTTVFFKGCPLRCVWCHNPEGLEFDVQIARYNHKCVGCGECKREDFTPEKCLGESYVIYGKEMSIEELLSILLEDREFYENSEGGVTLSGGECLMQADFCAELLRRLKDEGIHTAVDTCGYASKKELDKVIPYTDVFLYDLKAYNDDVHVKCTGRSNKIILENLEYLDSLGKKTEIRIPYVPDFNDGEIEAIADFIAKLKHVTKIRVLGYHNFAASKYEALGMEDDLPPRTPSEHELCTARELVHRKTSLEVLS